jgi:hypothetical protein
VGLGPPAVVRLECPLAHRRTPNARSAGTGAAPTKDDERYGRPDWTARPRYGGVHRGSNPRTMEPFHRRGQGDAPNIAHGLGAGCGEPLEGVVSRLLACRHRLFPRRSLPGRRTPRACSSVSSRVGQPAKCGGPQSVDARVDDRWSPV